MTDVGNCRSNLHFLPNSTDEIRVLFEEDTLYIEMVDPPMNYVRGQFAVSADNDEDMITILQKIVHACQGAVRELKGEETEYEWHGAD